MQLKVLESSPDAKTIRKVGRLLSQYSLGISANKGIDPEVALVFGYQLLSDHIIEVLEETKSGFQSDSQQAVERKRPESCLILEKGPNRLFIFILKKNISNC